MLSFIVPAHDEAALIGATIRAIQTAARDAGVSYEIVVVDDASSDGTRAVAEAAGARVVRAEVRQIAAARNAGAAVAKGDTLVFVDADTLVNVAVIRGVVAARAAGAVAGGAAVAVDDPTPRYVKRMMPVVAFLFRRLRWAAGCFLWCSRAAFDAVHGFDEKLFVSEEIALSRALHRHGRFVVLKESVLTSGRKMRTYSGREVFGTFVRIGLGGRGALQDRRGLGMWYGPRREDPSRH
jgi:glycosyltransferase involved in cell wall biosynthesis